MKFSNPPTSSLFILGSIIQHCYAYPNKTQIASIFASLGSQEGYLKFLNESVEPDVQWTLTGTHQLAGIYHNSTIFYYDTVVRLGSTLDLTKNSSFVLLDPIIGGGDEEWSVQQLHGTGTFKNGMLYDNRFAWATRWNEQGKIVEVNSYFDSAMVARALTENESPSYNSTSIRDKLVIGPIGLNCK